jgi:hypothetical protein
MSSQDEFVAAHEDRNGFLGNEKQSSREIRAETVQRMPMRISPLKPVTPLIKQPTVARYEVAIGTRHAVVQEQGRSSRSSEVYRTVPYQACIRIYIESRLERQVEERQSAWHFGDGAGQSANAET